MTDTALGIWIGLCLVVGLAISYYARRRHFEPRITKDTSWALRGTETWHVVPLNDIIPHTADPLCRCGPEQDDACPDLWIHRSADRREDTKEKGLFGFWCGT